MRYFSTRDASKSEIFSLKEAAFAGLAPDGGLFMPERIPQADMDKVCSLAAKSYADLALYLAGLFFGEDIPGEQLEAMVRRAYDFPCPLRPLDGKISVLELFHGPTFAFKDFGARFMGGMLGLLNDSAEPLTVLTATSGDTGSAVAAGFLGVKGVEVVVLYPEGKVSPLQESQMTTLGGNITAGMLAAAMGMPVRRFIAAANANSVIPEFLESGIYRPRPSVRTVANAMDVGAPSNYERMMCLYGDYENLVKHVEGYWYPDSRILEGIRAIRDEFGFISDPHAATGFLAARESGARGFYLATAHCAKFGSVIKDAIGIEPELPEGLKTAMLKEKIFTAMDNSLAELEKNI